METIQPRETESQAAERLRAAFERVGNPMLLVDDQRWCVTANAPACGLLEMIPEAVPWCMLDDFTSARDRDRVDEVWEAFLANGAMEGCYQLPLPTGAVLPVEFSATANVLPGRHLSVVVPRVGARVAAAPNDPHTEELQVQRGRFAIARRRAEWVRIAPPDASQLPLTDREREVLGLIAGGLQSARIADHLVLSTETIKSHAQNAMAKLGAHTRAHAVAIALSTGQVDLQGPSSLKGP